MQKANIICLQETKLELISSNFVRSLWGCQFLDWYYLPSSEASGGILLMWDKRVVKKIESCGGIVLSCTWCCISDCTQPTNILNLTPAKYTKTMEGDRFCYLVNARQNKTFTSHFSGLIDPFEREREHMGHEDDHHSHHIFLPDS
jgi:hypothetical protein